MRTAPMTNEIKQNRKMLVKSIVLIDTPKKNIAMEHVANQQLHVYSDRTNQRQKLQVDAVGRVISTTHK